MIRIRKQQYDQLDKIYKDHFYDELFNYLSEHFPEFDEPRKKALFDQCNASCKMLRITSEKGILTFHVLSFMNEAPVDSVDKYMYAHKRYILIGNEPDQLPIDLYEAMA